MSNGPFVSFYNYGNESPVVPHDPAESPLIQQAQSCIQRCQSYYPRSGLFGNERDTISANGYRACLSDCSGLPPDSLENWPADLIRTTGQDLQTGARAVTAAISPTLLLVLGIALAGAFVVSRAT